MRIGVFLGTPPPQVGGGYTYATELLKCIRECSNHSKHHFSVIGWERDPPPIVQKYELEYLSLYGTFPRRAISRLVRDGRRLLRQLVPRSAVAYPKKWEHQLILNHGIEMMWHLTPTWLTLEVPYISTVWDLEHRMQPYFPEISTEGQWSKREGFYSDALRRAAIIITGTNAGKAIIEQLYQIPRERIKVLPYPVPAFASNARRDTPLNVRAKYEIPDGYVLYPAQFWPHKNHVGLLLAVQVLRDRYDLTIPLVFVGSDRGNQTYVKETAEALGLSGQVFLLGFVPQEDLTALYQHALGLGFVSFFGPDNLPPLEAFALGCPVIASNVMGAQEQLGGAALLVDPRNAEDIAAAIKLLYDDKSLRHTLIAKGAERAGKSGGREYVEGVIAVLDEFESIRRCWSAREAFRQI